LDKYGHIYMHRFRPRDHVIQAHPLAAYPAKSVAGASLMLMVQNNLDQNVAQFPHELITYGGNGSAFSNWAQYRLTMQHLSAMTDHQTLCLHSGHPMGVFPSHPDAPRLVVTNGMVVPNYSSREDYEEMYCAGVSQFGQMTAGSFCYIGPQGIVHGTTLTLLNAGRKYLGTRDSLQGKLFVTAGLGGMSGAQAKAAVIAGGVAIVAEVDKNAVEKRYRQGWVLEKTSDLDECLDLARAAIAQGRATSIAYHGNVVDLWERFAMEATKRRDLPSGEQQSSSACIIPELGSDQTSCHNPFAGGYFPVGLKFEEAQTMLANDPTQFKTLVEASLRRHVKAINTLANFQQGDDKLGSSSGQFHFFDYGNSFLLEAARAGADVLSTSTPHSLEGNTSEQPELEATKDRDLKFRYPSYVQDIMGDIFSLGFGPFRWVCTSGDPEDLQTTDKIAYQVLTAIKEEYLAETSQESGETAADDDDALASGLAGRSSYATLAVPQLNDNLLWIEAAESHQMVVGSQARILYANAAARVRMATAFNAAVASGALKAPVMLSRDHHDVSGTDAPWRETSNVDDGSKFTADMAIHNVIGDAARGATSVSIHNGGGTGWGEAINGGFLLLLDGSPAAGNRAESMLHWDVFNGVQYHYRSTVDCKPILQPRSAHQLA
jgi:urocanate hydratase